MTRGGSIQGKRLFWIGMGLNALGMALIVWAAASALVHGAGALLVVLGIVLALRHCRL